MIWPGLACAHPDLTHGNLDWFGLLLILVLALTCRDCSLAWVYDIRVCARVCVCVKE